MIICTFNQLIKVRAQQTMKMLLSPFSLSLSLSLAHSHAHTRTHSHSLSLRCPNTHARKFVFVSFRTNLSLYFALPHLPQRTETRPGILIQLDSNIDYCSNMFSHPFKWCLTHPVNCSKAFFLYHKLASIR